MNTRSAFSKLATATAFGLAAASSTQAQTIIASVSGTPRTTEIIDGTTITAGVTPLAITYTFDAASVIPSHPGIPSFDGYYETTNASVTFNVGAEGSPDFRSFGGPVLLLELRVINNAILSTSATSAVDVFQIRATTATPYNLYQVEFTEPPSTTSDNSVSSFIDLLSAGSWSPSGALIYSFFSGGSAGSFYGEVVATSARTVVPEPSSYAILAGLATLGAAAVRRRRG